MEIETSSPAAPVETPAPAAPAVESGTTDLKVDIGKAVDDISADLLDSLDIKDDETAAIEAAAAKEATAKAAGETPATPAPKKAAGAAAATPAAVTPAAELAAAAPAPTKDIDPTTGKPRIPATLPNGLPNEFRTWRPEAQALLLKVQANPELKPLFEETLKREQDMEKGLTQYREAAGFAEVFRKTLQPFMPLIQHYQLDPMKEVASLMEFRKVLALGTPEDKAGLLRHIAKSAGVSFEALGAEEPALDPQVEALQKRLAEVESKSSQQLEALRTERANQLRTELEAFANDPANRYFAEVAGEIPRLIKSGLAKDFKTAYEMAVKLDPVVSAKEAQRLVDEATAKAREKAEAEAAARAKAKSANVVSSAKNRSAAAPIGSIEDTLKETLREITSRG